MAFAAFGALLVLAGAIPAEDPRVDPGLDRFRRDVGPILTSRCLTCHNSEGKKGGLDLSRRATALAGGDSGPAVEPGKPDESVLIDMLSDGLMPPKNPLSPEQVAAFRAWIEAGAPYEAEPLAPPGPGRIGGRSSRSGGPRSPTRGAPDGYATRSTPSSWRSSVRTN